MNRIIVRCTLAVLCLSPVLTNAQVSVKYNHRVPFAQFHSYAWAGNNTNQVQNSHLAQVAQQDINHGLSQRGLQLVQPSQNPDLIVTASGGERAQTSWNAWSMRGIGGGSEGLLPSRTTKRP